MVAAVNMEHLFVAAAGASERVMTVRDQARVQSVRAIREMERRVQEAIMGDTLRGMANLNPMPHEKPIQGARLQRDPNGKAIDAKVAVGRRAIVLDKDGRFQQMAVALNGDVLLTPVLDDEFLAQDLEPVTRLVRAVLERHVARADATAATYRRVKDLAETLTETLAR